MVRDENVFVKMMEGKEIEFTGKDYLEYLMNQIDRGAKPSSKAGYYLKETFYPEENRTIWTYVPIAGYAHPSGDYLNPIEYFVGMTVEKDLFYTDGDNIWMAIKTGIAPGFDSTEYFEIVGV